MPSDLRYFQCILLICISWLSLSSSIDPAYRHIGCFRDADMGGGERLIATLEHSDERLDGGYRGRRDAVRKCAAVAWDRKFPGFALQDGGWCCSAANMMSRYDLWGSADNLPEPYHCQNGVGGLWSNDVYEFLGMDVDVDGNEL